MGVWWLWYFPTQVSCMMYSILELIFRKGVQFTIIVHNSLLNHIPPSPTRTHTHRYGRLGLVQQLVDKVPDIALRLTS